jgi:O-antigen biosynthesis protein
VSEDRKIGVHVQRSDIDPGVELAAAISDAIDGARRKRLLFISHAWGGGVEQHVEDIIALQREHVDILVLRGFLNGGVELSWHSATASTTAVRVGGFGNSRIADWVSALAALDFSRIHIHHLHGWPQAILSLVYALERPIDWTLHDYFAICPQYNLSNEDGSYCGEPDESGCNECIAKRPHSWATNIASWRALTSELLSRADRVITPSHDVVRRLKRHGIQREILVWPHPLPVPLAPPRTIKIALLGGLSPIKGLRVLERVAAEARQAEPLLTFRLIGHAAEPLPSGVTATGSYTASRLPRLIADERPDVLWFPSQVPETYSYTLSAAIESGLAIVAANLGALTERLVAIEQALLVDYDASTQTWIDALKRAASLPRTKRTTFDERAIDDNYATRYLRDGESANTGDANALANLLQGSLPAPRAIARPIRDVFLVGRHGGHVESLDSVEQQLNALSLTETEIAGRSDLDAARMDANRLHDALALQYSAQGELRAMLASTEQRASKLAQDLVVRQLELNARIRELDVLRSENRHAASRIAYLSEEFARITTSRSWRMTRPLRFAVRVGRLARRNPRLLTSALSLIPKKGFGVALSVLNTTALGIESRESASARPLLRAAVKIEALTLDTSSNPVVSIVIPVYGHHETTFECLRSIATFAPKLAFEVIVMDDASPALAQEALGPVTGIRIIRNEKNLGFIGNVNAGAACARGEYLLILNNDTVLTENAVDAMYATFSRHASVGLVGAKLLNEDGTLQEAGGIVWCDGSAWNWGRGKDPNDPTYNFVRDADYCSGAALMIRRALFLELGGFDTHYAPAYYEDTDLAFRVRAHGLRVLYQPHASIYHLEGISHGRDTNSGVKGFQTANAKKFFERWKAVLAGHRANGESAALEAHRDTRKNILVIEAFLITPDQDSGSLRLLNLLRILKDEGHHVIFVADNLEGTPKYRTLLESLGVEVLYDAWAMSVHDVLRARGPSLDAVIICRHYVAAAYLDAVRLSAPDATMIFDTVDLHFLREEREAALNDDPKLAEKAAKTRKQELGVCQKADVTFVVSEVEAGLLHELLPQAHVEIVSNIHESETERPGFEDRVGILFVGGFRHPPNVDAIKWYAIEVLPHLRRLAPSLVTRVVGSNIPAEIRALDCANLQILGHAEDLKPILRSSRVSIAPLRYGAGVKGKINEAMNFGIPVVATSMAIEGMHLRDGTHCLVADDPEKFAKCVVELHENAVIWQSIVDAASRSVAQHFSMSRARDTLRAVLASSAQRRS